MKLKFLAAIAFLAPLLTYVWQNGNPVTITFIKWHYPVSQAILVLGALLVGVILGLLLSHAWRNKEKTKQKKADKKVKQQQKTAEKLKKQQEKQRQAEAKKNNSDATVNPHDDNSDSADNDTSQ